MCGFKQQCLYAKRVVILCRRATQTILKKETTHTRLTRWGIGICIRSFVPCFGEPCGRRGRSKARQVGPECNKPTRQRASPTQPPHIHAQLLRRSAFAGTVLVAIMSGLAPSLSLPPLIIIIASSLMNSSSPAFTAAIGLSLSAFEGLRRQAIKAAMVIPIMDNLTSSPGIRDSRGYSVLTAARSMFIACAHGLYQQYLSPMSTGIGLRRSSSRSDI